MADRRMGSSVVWAAVLGIFALLALAPVLLTFVNSFMTAREIEQNYGLIGQLEASGPGKQAFGNLKLTPDWVTFEQYAQLLLWNPKFMNMFWHLTGMVAPIIAGHTVVASLAAYAFARLRFRGRDKLFLVYVMTMLLPFQVTLVPNYLIVERFGLMNTEAAIVLPGIFGVFGVFMLRQFMLQIPQALTEAAALDGAGHTAIFARIVLPLTRPGLAALMCLLFVDYWNMVEQPLVFLTDAARQPLSLYLAQLGQQAKEVSFAASVLYMAPMVLLFLYAETYFTQGIQHSGLKG